LRYNFAADSFWAIVCRMVHPMLSDRCLSCLSVTLVYCGQTVGWIKMQLGMQVGLSPGHIALDMETQLPLPKGAQPPIFGQYLLRLNGCMDQDATWYGGMSQHRGLCVRWGPRSHSPKKGTEPPNFRPLFIVIKRLGGSRWYLAYR